MYIHYSSIVYFQQCSYSLRFACRYVQLSNIFGPSSFLSFIQKKSIALCYGTRGNSPRGLKGHWPLGTLIRIPKKEEGNFYGVISLGRVVVPYLKIVINFPGTFEKLHCKEKPYWFTILKRYIYQTSCYFYMRII